MHPEMTAKENIFLNGSIMGMTRKEVKAKFDEIIDFAGVGKYVDTPIKRFSSGMKVRLGFAVAAFLEPEILIVDEVLAVGDAQFQKKAIGKMQDVSKGGGRTVLFVSHNMASIENLCTRCLILNNGNISFQGGTKSAITHYLKKENDDISSDLLKIKDRSGTGEVLFKKFYLENESDEELETLTNKNGGVLCFKLECKQNNIENVEVGFSIHDEQDVMLTHVKTSYQSFSIAKMNKGEYTLKYKIKPLPLHEGTYLIRGRISSKDCEFDWPKKPLARINVIHGDYFGTGTYKVISNSKFLIKGEWQFDLTAD
jgi:lipopolysaccharide transport system ATP-binding protein